MSANTLLVKLSSMGDVVHSFPALTDAALHGHTFDWVVEEAFVELAALHPAVDRVLPFGLRRWRKTPVRGLLELGRFSRLLRREGYSRVLDAQGLLKSALVTRVSGANERHGLAAHSAREPASVYCYTHKHAVSWNLHAIDRVRLLFAQALGYEVDLQTPASAPFSAVQENGMRSKVLPTVLIHGTTWPSKEYPEAGWRALIARLRAAGHLVQLLSGSAIEHARAERLVECEDSSSVASSVELPRALAPGSLLAACEKIQSARLVIGVDSGLTHLAAVLGRPTVGLYGPTNAQSTGVRGPRALDLASAFPCAPCLQRTCSYRGEVRLLAGANAEPACFAELDPQQIIGACERLLAAGQSAS